PPDLLEVARAVGGAPARVDSVWPGYSLREQGFLLYTPGESALLVTSEPAPAGFTPLADSLLPAALRGRAYAFAGGLPGLEGGVDTRYRIGRLLTTAYAPGASASLRSALAGLYHEGFHTYQDRRFSAGGVDDRALAEPLTGEFAALVEVERRMLATALARGADATLDSLLQGFLAVRHRRLREASAEVLRVDGALERIEGSANLVGHASAAAALGADTGRAVGNAVREYLTVDLDRFGGDRATQLMRWRAYGTGAALGLLLDRRGAAWRTLIEEGASFHALLERAIQFDAERAPSLAGKALEAFGYEDILENEAETTSADEELHAFYALAPVRLVIDVAPRDTAAYELRVSHNSSFGFLKWLLRRRHGTSQPVAGLTLVWSPDVLHTSDPAGAGFTLRVEGRPVALDGRAGRTRRRFVVLLPELPVVESVAPPTRGVHPAGVVIEGAGTRFETALPAEVIIVGPDSMHVRISP
ncbi:MAG: hypothetical protein WEA24_14830, partial [Gemmatimonadota bacterium]